MLMLVWVHFADDTSCYSRKFWLDNLLLLLIQFYLSKGSKYFIQLFQVE